MSKKNSLPIKLMLGVMIILMAILFWRHQTSNYTTISVASNVSSSNGFLQFLANIFGWETKSPSSGEASNENNLSNQNTADFEKAGSLTANQKNPNSIAASNASGAQGSKADQEGNSDESNQGLNAENNSGNNSAMNSSNNSTDNSATNADNNSGDNSETNADNNSGDNSETNADQGTGNPADNSSVDNSDNNADNNSGGSAGDNSGGNSGDNSGGNPGDNSGCTPGCYAGCNTQCDALCTTACSEGIKPPNVFETGNPIPTDSDAALRIAAQNQQRDSLAALVATQQAIAAQVRQSAEATKYQTVTAESITPTDTTPAPQDVVDKIKSTKLVLP